MNIFSAFSNNTLVSWKVDYSNQYLRGLNMRCTSDNFEERYLFREHSLAYTLSNIDIVLLYDVVVHDT